MNNKPHRALEWLHKVGRVNRDIWLAHDIARHQRRWPEHVFAPTEITERLMGELGIAIPAEWAPVVAALSAWRSTQGIYRFAPALLDALLATPVTGEIPREVLHRIPEWCVYLEIEREINGWHVHGAWAYLDLLERPHDSGALTEALRLVILHGGNDECLTYTIPLPDTVDASVARATFWAPADYAAPSLEHVGSVIEPIVSLLLYVGSTNAEIRDPKTPSRTPSRPKVQVDKHGRSRWYAAQQATIWETGTRLGAALDAAKARTTSPTSSPTGRTVRPHVRRAHWHHVWIGPRDDSQKRRLELKWWSPILVNFGDGEKPDAATIRPVEGNR